MNQKRIRFTRNREIDSPSQIDRFNAVLGDFDEFVDEYQRDLAEQAIIWALAKLAGHERADDIAGSYFLAMVDIMYSATTQAQRIYSQDECSQLRSDSAERHSALMPQIGKIIQKSCQQLASLEEENLCRTIGDALHKVRTSFIDTAPPEQMLEMIVQCSEACCVLDGVESGKISRVEANKQLVRLYEATARTIQIVMDRVKTGELIVVNGKIVEP